MIFQTIYRAQGLSIKDVKKFLDKYDFKILYCDNCNL